jgi:hypothetical protein
MPQAVVANRFQNEECVWVNLRLEQLEPQAARLGS